MIKKVYLLWDTYKTKELLVVASLNRINKGYCFKYEKDALKAMEYGCMLPFGYTEREIYFNALPQFFSQRMLRRDMLQRLGMSYDPNDELSILVSNYGRRINDNFYVVKEDFLEKKEKVNVR